MSLKEKINEDLKTAMKSRDDKSLRSIKAIKAAIIVAETSEGRTSKELTQEEEIQLLQKLIKQRKESVEIYQKNNRPELAQKELEEIEVIEKYLPKQLSEAELTAIIQEAIVAENATSVKDMGKVMKAIQPKVFGKADNKLVSEIIKKQLGV